MQLVANIFLWNQTSTTETLYSVSFSNWENEDTLKIYLLGDDCEKAVVSLVIRDVNGRPIFWDSFPLWNITPYPLSDDGEIERAFGLLRDAEVERSSESPALDSDCFDDYCYLGPYTDADLFNTVKASNVPVLCIPVHYENTRCYYRKTDEHVTSILYGYGA